MLYTNTLKACNDIPMSDIFDRLGIQLDGSMGATRLCEGGKSTSGWRFNRGGNYVCDFSHDRAQGGPYAFVMKHLGLTAAETFGWFEKNFDVDAISYRQSNHYGGYYSLSLLSNIVADDN